ncbi:MAG: BMC domain-containing protein [Sarcina sp.]
MLGSIGIVEVVGIVAAIESLDAMGKASNITFVTCEKKLGGRLVSIIIKGRLEDVTHAVQVGERVANKITKCVANAVIARPHEEVFRLIEISSEKYK